VQNHHKHDFSNQQFRIDVQVPVVPSACRGKLDHLCVADARFMQRLRPKASNAAVECEHLVGQNLSFGAGSRIAVEHLQKQSRYASGSTRFQNVDARLTLQNLATAAVVQRPASVRA
jgi:hypothetical protein